MKFVECQREEGDLYRVYRNVEKESHFFGTITTLNIPIVEVDGTITQHRPVFEVTRNIKGDWMFLAEELRQIADRLDEIQGKKVVLPTVEPQIVRREASNAIMEMEVEEAK